jgi:hypothetical protein
MLQTLTGIPETTKSEDDLREELKSAVEEAELRSGKGEKGKRGKGEKGKRGKGEKGKRGKGEKGKRGKGKKVRNLQSRNTD